MALKKSNYKTHFSKPLLDWYLKNKRDLPWRSTKDPYLIWISEVMLQQTQVITVIPYYLRFIEALPTVFDLANVKEETLLKLFEGLGYYKRARNLKEAAKSIVSDYAGVFPNTYSELIKLKGIGPYTAGAILSIAFDKKYPAIDGNVLRVLSRNFGIKEDISKSKTQKKISLLNKDLMIKPYKDFTQSLMELGSEICKTKNALCDICPVKDVCYAYKHNEVYEIPINLKKVKKETQRYQTFILKDDNDHYIILKQKTDLLKGLYLFPQILGESLSYGLTKLEDIGFNNIVITSKTKKRHVFTHLVWEMDVYYGYAEISNPKFTLTKDLEDYPFATAHKKIKL